MIPTYVANFNEWWGGVVVFADKHGVTLPEVSFNAEKATDMISEFLNKNTNTLFDTTIGITSSILGGLFDGVLGVSFSIYILAEKEMLTRWAKKIVYAYLKEEKADKIVGFAKLTSQTFTNFITGQFIEAVIIGVLCFIGMSILRMPYASIISVLVGATALIPILGAYIGTIIGAFLILLVSPIKALIFVLFIIVLQQLEGNLIYPKVVGKSIGIPGILVLAAVTIGAKLFGVAGMLIGVPACAVIYCLLRESIGKRLHENKLIEKI
jgi:predicted PurR-regulated permease PerM